MPESNHEVIIDGYVYPDIVTITLANDDFVGSRDYVSKDLYESVSSANDYWQAENAKLRQENQSIGMAAYELGRKSMADENAKLRELVRHMGACIQHLDRSDEDGGCVLCPYQSVEHDCEFESRMCELGVEADDE